MREPAHLRLRLEEGQTFGFDPTGPLTEGALLRLPSVSVEPLPEPRPGDFDYGRYLRRRGEHVLLEADFADLALVGRRGGLQGAVDRLRLASRAHLRAGVRSPVSDVLQGMVLGDDEGVDQALVDDFRKSGLLHIMAVSGENVVLLCAMWSFAFALLGMPRLLRTALLAARRRDLRAAHRRVAVDRARRRRRHLRPARRSSPRGPATAGCSGSPRRRGCSRSTPTTSST